jgi:hemerythrin
MTKILWRPQLAVGIEAIDHDHKILIRYINDLDAAIHTDRFNTKTVARTLVRLIEYTREHFEREEQAMRKVHYPHYDEHIAEHRKCVDAIQDLCHEFIAKPDRVSAEHLYQFATDWLINHIILVDMRMAPYVRGVWV